MSNDAIERLLNKGSYCEHWPEAYHDGWVILGRHFVRFDDTDPRVMFELNNVVACENYGETGRAFQTRVHLRGGSTLLVKGWQMKDMIELMSCANGCVWHLKGAIGK